MPKVGESRKKPHRSPAYPSMDLKAAIGYAELIRKHERDNSAPVSVVAQHCGMDIKSSKALRLIAALKQYGLVKEEGGGDDRQVGLTTLAMDILLPDSPEAKSQAIKKAALLPPTHKKVWDNYKGNLPSDPTIRVYLLRQLEFNELYVDKFIKRFRASLAFAVIGSSDKIGGEGPPQESGGQTPVGKAKEMSAAAPENAGNVVVRDFPIPLMGGGIAVVKVPVPMSETDFEQITGTLKAWKSALVRSTGAAASAPDVDDEIDDDDGEDEEE